jgi:hypothetical protein
MFLDQVSRVESRPPLAWYTQKEINDENFASEQGSRQVANFSQAYTCKYR